MRDKLDALRRSPLFELLSPAELEAVAELSKPVRFAAGEIVFEKGDMGDALYVLASGEIEILSGAGPEARPFALRAAPESFGEMSLVDREERSATVRARTDCAALRLTAENFTAFRKRSRDGFTLVVVNVARALSRRLREANAALAGRSTGSP